METRLAGWLRAELGRRGWTQADLVRASGLSPAMVSRLLKGERSGSTWDTQIALAQALGLTHAELIARVNSDPLPPSVDPAEPPAAYYIRYDPELTAAQKEALLAVYWSYRGRRPGPRSHEDG